MKVIPTVAFKPSDKLSLGFGLSINWHALELSHPFDMNSNGLFDTQFTLNNASSFGIGANSVPFIKWIICSGWVPRIHQNSLWVNLNGILIWERFLQK